MLLADITANASTPWIVLSAVLIFLFLAAAFDSFGLAFWATVIGVLILQFATIADPFAWVKANRGWVITGALCYLPIGVGWSVFRWAGVLRKYAAELRTQKSAFKPGNYYRSWEEYVNSMFPTVANNKSRIMFWITYWPVSAVAYLCFDVLRDIGEWVYSHVSGMYLRMREKVIASLTKE